jgi:phage terminase large subunit-like protein
MQLASTVAETSELALLEIEEQRLKLELEERDILRELGGRTTFGYTKYTFRAYKRENWHHRLIADYLQMAIEKKITRLMVYAPPRHMKSENLERAFSYSMGKNPDDKIIICGHTAPKARKISNHIKSNVTDPRHLDIFPDFPGINGENTQHFWELGNGWRGSLLAAGRSGPITGEGFNLAGIDDLVKDREQAESPTFHEKNYDWYSSTFLSRQDEEDSVIVIVNTRWNPKDICGRILAIDGIKEYNGQSPTKEITGEDGEPQTITCPEYNGDPNGEWTILCLPAEMDHEFYEWKHPIDPREPGEALWPERFSTKHLKQFKKNKHSWNSEWQQRPRPKGGNVIDRSWFKICRDFPRNGKLVRFWDMASTPKEEAKKNDPDFTAGVLATYVDGNIYIIDIVATRKSPKARWALMKQTAEMDYLKYGGKVLQVWEEEGGSSGKDASEVLKDDEVFGEYLRAPFPVKKNKQFYIDYLANKAESGNLYCVNPSAGLGKDEINWLIEKCDGNTFFDEAEIWPSKSAHDDRLDAAAKACFILIKRIIKSFFGEGSGTEEEYKPQPHNPETEKNTTFQSLEKEILTKRKIDISKITDLDLTLTILEEISRKYAEKGDSVTTLLVMDEIERIEDSRK